MDDKVRFGGMALVNGVLVHGPQSWACAIRTADGELKVAARTKSFRAAEVQNPILRGPARIAEVFALLPQVRKALPEAKLCYPPAYSPDFNPIKQFFSKLKRLLRKAAARTVKASL